MEFIDAVGQRCKDGLFLDIEEDINYKEFQFFEIGKSTEGEPGDFYIAYGPGDTDGYLTNEEAKGKLAHSIYMEKFLKYAFKEEVDEYRDYVFSNNTDMTFVLIKLAKWLGKKRNVLKTNNKWYKFVLKNTK